MRQLALLAVAALAAAPALSAQESNVGRQPTRQEKLVLDQRDREDLHEGSDPFHIVGLEQGDNGFRDRTPTLAATDGHVTKVDTEELRQRQIAMLTGRSLFRRPPSAASGFEGSSYTDSSGGVEHERPADSVPAEEQPADGGESTLVILACALGCGAAAFAVKKLAL